MCVRYSLVFATFPFVALHGYPPSQEQGDEEDDVTDSDGDIEVLFSPRGWFESISFFSPLPEEMIRFDPYFSDGLKPP